MVAGRYTLGERLGVGAMASVFRATDEVLGREVAVKIFTSAQDPDHPERITAEMRTIASLNHPGLVAVHDAGVDEPEGGHPRSFMVMQLVDGPTLADRLRQGPFDPEKVRSIGACLSDAIAYMHSRGVIHRDIKPANVLMDDEDRPHLTDFGIAHSIGAERLTATGTTIGTAAYISPEQVEGRALTPAVDIYSLGLTLLECLTARREYPGSITESALARLTRPPALDGLDDQWATLLRTMTAIDPADRPSPSEVHEALSTSTPSTVTAPVTPARTERVTVAPTEILELDTSPTTALAVRRGRRRIGLWLGAAAAAAVVIGLIASSGDGTPATVSPSPSGPPAFNQLDHDLVRLHELVAR